MRFIDESDALTHARKEHQAQRAEDERTRTQAAEWGSDPKRVAADLAKKRLARLERVQADVAPTLETIRTRMATMRSSLVSTLPGDRVNEETAGAIDRIVDGERIRRKAPSDAARFAHLPKKELVRRAEETADPIELADISLALAVRGEQGDDDAQGTAAMVATKLGHVVAALPSVVTRAEEYQRLATIEENLGYTLKALETGGIDDGVRFDSYAEMSRARAPGDSRQAILENGPDGDVLKPADTVETRASA
jgi:hypothetical protein